MVSIFDYPPPPPKQDEGWGWMGKKTEFAKKNLNWLKIYILDHGLHFLATPLPPSTMKQGRYG